MQPLSSSHKKIQNLAKGNYTNQRRIQPRKEQKINSILPQFLARAANRLFLIFIILPCNTAAISFI
jgi:hypothetical protein